MYLYPFFWKEPVELIKHETSLSNNSSLEILYLVVTEGSQRLMEPFTAISISKFFRFFYYYLFNPSSSAKEMIFSIFLSKTLLTYSTGAIFANPLIACRMLLELGLLIFKRPAKVLMSCSEALLL